MNNIKELIVEVREGQSSPPRLAEIATQLAGWYATLSEEYENAVIFKADRWLELRKDVKSDKMADRLWDASPEGQKCTRLHFQMSYIEKCISTIKMRLRVKISESYNNI